MHAVVGKPCNCLDAWPNWRWLSCLMYAIVTGKPYDPLRRAWGEGADYNFRAGGHELRIFLGHTTPREIAR